MDILGLAVALTVTSLKHLFVIGAAAKLIVIKRYFYDGRGILVKLFWYAGCGATTARSIAADYGLEVGIAQILCILPIVSLFSTTFSFASQVVPEINLARMGQSLKQLSVRARKRKDFSR